MAVLAMSREGRRDRRFGVPRRAWFSYARTMAKTLSVDEALERAQRAQEARMGAIRAVAEARQIVVDVREETDRELAEFQRRIADRVATAEREDVRAFNAALSAGWTVDELRKIGFPEPDKKVRTRRRAAKRDVPAQSTPSDS